MLLLLLGCCLFSMVLADHHHCDCRSQWGPLVARAQAHESRLNQLSGQVETLKNKLQESRDAVSGYRARFLELTSRVGDLEGTGCAKREFQCGGDNPHCISDVLVCDGGKDCDNGHDEDPQVCKNLIPAGATFVGVLDRNHDFCTKRKPDELILLITSVRRANYFQSRLKIKGQLKIKFHSKNQKGVDVLPVEGYYNFAAKQLVILPPEDDRLGLVCTFKHGHEDKCHANILHEATLKACSSFTFVKQ